MREHHTRWRKWSWDRRLSEEKVWSDWKVFGKVRRQKESREIEGYEKEFALTLYIEIHNSWEIERCREVSRFKTRESAVKELSRICREVSIAKGFQWIKKLSRIYQASRKFLDGSSSYRECDKKKLNGFDR